MAKQANKPAFVIHVDAWEFVQVGVWRDRAKLESWFKTKGFRDVSRRVSGTNAVSVRYRDRDGVTWHGMYLPTKSPAHLVAHECLHAAWGILKTAGVKVKYSNHETLAYLQQYLIRAVYGER